LEKDFESFLKIDGFLASFLFIADSTFPSHKSFGAELSADNKHDNSL